MPEEETITLKLLEVFLKIESLKKNLNLAKLAASELFF